MTDCYFEMFTRIAPEPTQSKHVQTGWTTFPKLFEKLKEKRKDNRHFKVKIVRENKPVDKEYFSWIK